MMRQAGQFTTVLKYVAGKLGKSVVFLDPKGTSQSVEIVSRKCLKNGQIDGIPVRVGSPWLERKIQPNLSKDLARITKVAVLLRH